MALSSRRPSLTTYALCLIVPGMRTNPAPRRIRAFGGAKAVDPASTRKSPADFFDPSAAQTRLARSASAVAEHSTVRASARGAAPSAGAVRGLPNSARSLTMGFWEWRFKMAALSLKRTVSSGASSNFGAGGSSRSASSKTSVSTSRSKASQSRALVPAISVMRFAVPMTTRGRSRTRRRWSSSVDTPSEMSTSGACAAHSDRATTPSCTASSSDGTTTSMRPPSSSSIFERAGTRKASVLPLPVGAWMITSP
mmetsp:Transcript_10480/g.34721  ORF Transcript_10480/g.34721 Transcript_10480/m.34721 type:complete len:253 (-) Transcript_10480:115-873(-)